MKIIPPAATQDLASGPAKSGAVYTMQWRKALELAEWQARQRIAPAGQTGADAQQAFSTGSSAMASESGCAPEVIGTPIDSASTALPPQYAANGAARMQALATAVANAIRAQPTSVPANVQPSLALPVAVDQQAVGITARPVEAQAGAAPGWYALPEWPAVMVHASVQGNRISVGMRDRSLRDEDAIDLFYRLSAQLRATGFTLTSLTVNGHNVAAADAATPPTA